MEDALALPLGYAMEETEDGGFRLTAPLPCPAGEARCLAVVAASWVRAALGGDAKILWPNHVVLGERRVCPIQCRATAAGDLVFTFRPDYDNIPVPPEALRRAVTRNALEALAGYPENQPALLSDFCEHCPTVMKFVRTSYRGVPLYGFAFAVDRHGGLMVMTQESHTVVTLYGGEAEIVKKDEVPDETPEVPPMPGR